MFSKLGAFYNLFKLGQEVDNVEFWKGVQAQGQPVIAAILIAIVALLKGTKYEIPLSDDQAMLIAGGIFATTNFVLTLITSKRVGIKAADGVSANGQTVPSVQHAPIEDHSFSSVQPVTQATIEEAKAALDRDRGR